MSFQQAVEIEKLLLLSRLLTADLESIVEFGHVVLPNYQADKLTQRSQLLQKQLEACVDELDAFVNEMTDWYSY